MIAYLKEKAGIDATLVKKNLITAIIGNKSVEEILMQWFPDGDFTEEDLWDAIAEANDVDVNEIADQDILSFI